MNAPMIVAAVVVAVGLSASFAGVAIRGRLRGLVTMGVGTVVMLAVASPARPAAVGMTLLSAATLAGMLVFGRMLARLIDGDGPDRRGIDESRR